MAPRPIASSMPPHVAAPFARDTAALSVVAQDATAGVTDLSEADDGLQFVSWSTWINVPLVLVFMLREWPKFGKPPPPPESTGTPPSPDGAPMRAGALVGRAVAGSVWSKLADTSDAHERNAALALTCTPLVAPDARTATLHTRAPDEPRACLPRARRWRRRGPRGEL